MTITIEQYLPHMKPAPSQAGEPVAGDLPPWKPGLGARFLIWGLKGTRKLPAPSVFRPVNGVRPNIVAEFARKHEGLMSMAHAADGVDLNRLRFASPVTALIRVSVADSFMILMLHSKRHLQQVVRVTQTPGFPSL
jgi:hypothetical protein